MLCYFVQRFWRNLMWLASRVSQGAESRATRRSAALDRAVEPLWSSTNHGALGRDRAERRAVCSTAERAGRGFRKFFRFFFRRDEPATLAVSCEATSQKIHDRIMMPTLQRPFKSRVPSCMQRRYCVFSSNEIPYMRYTASIDTMSEGSSDSM
jgi:hypothetical protein